MNKKDENQTRLTAAIAEAAEAGYSSLEHDGETFTLVKPGLTKKTGVQPFVGLEHFVPIQPKRAAYSDRTAWVMAEMSALAYIRFEDNEENKNIVIKALADADFIRPQFFDSDFGTQAFIAERADEFAVLAFRGTEKNKADILADLDANFLETPDGKAHRGFAKAFEAVERDVRAALETIYEKDAGLPIVITGHSLGGAIATAATQVLEQKFTVAACYTFGSPRIGTAEWSDSVKSPVYRVVNGADGVPMVPPSSILRDGVLFLTKLPLLHFIDQFAHKLFAKGFAGFQHAGDMRFIMDSSPAVLKMGSSAVFARFRHTVLGLLSRFFFWTGSIFGVKKLSAFFGDHSISRYAAILKAIAKERN